MDQPGGLCSQNNKNNSKSVFVSESYEDLVDHMRERHDLKIIEQLYRHKLQFWIFLLVSYAMIIVFVILIFYVVYSQAKKDQEASMKTLPPNAIKQGQQMSFIPVKEIIKSNNTF